MVSVITVLSIPNQNNVSVILVLHAVLQLVVIRFANICQKGLVKVALLQEVFNRISLLFSFFFFFFHYHKMYHSL